jgi:pimeloyl-ACP methyl ester carboxylesterase
MNDDRDPLHRFLSAATAERLALVRSGEVAEPLRAYLGDAAYREYASLASRLDDQHLAVGSQPNLVFVPGVMGTQLFSRTKGGVWWLDVRTRAHIDDLALNEDGTGDADPRNGVEPFTTDPQYEPFLTAALDRDEFGHEIFAYEWRKLPSESAARLRDLVLDMRERNGEQPVHLVAHSMGGLMVRAALAAHGDELWPLLGKVVFLGTPHYGSPAIGGYLKNHLWGLELLTLLGTLLSRATFRSLWGVLSLLPAPAGIYPGTDEGGEHPCSNFDLYDANAWKLDLDADETARLQRVLDGVAAYYQDLRAAHDALLAEEREKMLVIAGVGYKTLFRLEYTSSFFVWEKMKKVTDRIPGDPNRDGDGRVPLASAMLENVAIRFVRAVHGSLPNVPAVYDEVFRFLLDEDLRLEVTPGGAVSEHLAPDDNASVASHLDGSATSSDDDPGYLNLEPVDAATLADLEAALARDELPGFTRVRIV